MRIAFANAAYRPNEPAGGFAHVRQFIDNCVASGHEVWAWPMTEHPAVRPVGVGRLAELRALRQADVLYVRVEDFVPRSIAKYATGLNRRLAGNPLVAWEFNTVPEYGLTRGKSQADVDRAVAGLRRHAAGCDLAVCVSARLAEYVRDRIGIARTLVVPNGSDPDRFRPDVPSVPRLREANDGRLNVVWLGSADIGWHNFDLLREVAHAVRARGADGRIAFHIIGKGAGRMRDMPANVHYQGSERYDLLPSWLSGMDVGLVLYRPGPADYSSPLKLFDYMASGLAVLSVEQPQVREVLSSIGQADSVVPPDDAAGLADRLIALAGDRARARELGTAARRLLVERYAWKRAVDDVLAEFGRLVGGTAGIAAPVRDLPLTLAPTNTLMPTNKTTPAPRVAVAPRGAGPESRGPKSRTNGPQYTV